MTLAEAVYIRLTTWPGLAALVADRVYPKRAPEDVGAPYVTFQRVGGDEDQALAGPTGLNETRLQVDCWSDARDTVDTYTEARAVAIQVRAALNGWRGLAGDGGSPEQFLRIKSTRLDSDQELEEEDPRADRVSLDFIIAHDQES